MRMIGRVLLAIAFVFAGVMHFVKPQPFVSIVPTWIPTPWLAVYVSGAAEILGGIGILIARVRKTAGIGLILLLVAVFPANVNMAVNADRFPQFPPVLLWLRLPLQLVLIWLVCAATRTRSTKETP